MVQLTKPRLDGQDTFRVVEAWAAEPDDVEERLNRLREIHKVAPEFTTMLLMAHGTSPAFTFKDLAAVWPEKDGLDPNPNNQDVKDFYYKDFAKEAYGWVDSSPYKSKVAPCIGLLEWTHPDDVAVIKDIIFGRKAVSDRLNEELLGKLMGELLS